MKETPLVTVIINCYNGEQYLREAIDSVVNQTYQNWELIFWDNQSTDSSRTIVESYKNEKIRYFYAKEHTTLGGARKLAIKEAKGEYVGFLDCDDQWTPTKLEKQVQLLEPGKVELVYTNFSIAYNGTSRSGAKMYHYYDKIRNQKYQDNKSFYENLLRKNFVIFSSVLFNRRIYEEIGGLDDRFQQNVDYDLLLKFSLKTEVRSTNEEHVIYRIHDSNNSNKNGSGFILENRIIYDSLPDSKVLREAKERNEIRYAMSLFRQGDQWDGIKYFIRQGSLNQLINIIWWKITNQ